MVQVFSNQKQVLRELKKHIKNFHNLLAFIIISKRSETLKKFPISRNGIIYFCRQTGDYNKILEEIKKSLRFFDNIQYERYEVIIFTYNTEKSYMFVLSSFSDEDNLPKLGLIITSLDIIKRIA